MTERREPRVFAPDAPGVIEPIAGEDETAPAPQSAAAKDGFSATGVLISAMTALIGLTLSVSFARFVSNALDRNDWIGWTAASLLVVAGLAALVIIVREIAGLLRLARTARLRRSVETALATGDRNAEREAVAALRALFRGRPDLAWGLARLRDHAADVQDAGDLLKLADRELLSPLDREARRLILKSAKHVSVVTAMSPMVWIAMLYVLVENLRMLRAIAGLYGGRPGLIGALRLARMVIAHIVATGGLAMTDDLLGQFIGQDLLRRLSRRLGEGVFNGALTARIGTAAITVARPLPFLEADPIRLRDILAELTRKDSSGGKSA